MSNEIPLASSSFYSIGSASGSFYDSQFDMGLSGNIDPAQLELIHKRNILSMKTRQITELEAEIQQLIRIQSDQAKKLRATLKERDELQAKLEEAHKTFLQLAQMKNKENAPGSGLSSVSGLTDAVEFQTTANGSFLRCFLNDDGEYYEEVCQMLLKNDDPNMRNFTGVQIIDQIRQFLDIQEAVKTILDLEDVVEMSSTFENKIQALIGCKKVILWAFIESTSSFYSPTLSLVTDLETGLISECYQTQAKQIYSNPQQNKLYSDKIDANILNNAEHVLFCPVIKDKKFNWIIEVIDTVDSSGTPCPPSPNDIIIIDYFSKFINSFQMIQKLSFNTENNIVQKIFKETDDSFMSLYYTYGKAIAGVVGCEKMQVFFNDGDPNQLFRLGGNSITEDRKVSTIAEAGLTGAAFKQEKTISITVAKDSMFYEPNIDGEFPNSSFMAVPVKNAKDPVSCVIVARKKRIGTAFDENDETALRSFGQIAIASYLSEKSNQDDREEMRKAMHNQEYFSALLTIAKELSSILDLDILSSKIMSKAQQFLNADRCSLFIIDNDSQTLWSIVSNGNAGKIYVAMGEGIAGTVAATGKTINIPDAYSDSRFNPNVDKATGYRTRSILCTAIRNQKNEIIGVTQMINKKNGQPFNDTDVELIQAFNVFCGIALTNASIYKNALDNKHNMQAILNVLISISNSPTFQALIASITHNAKDLLNAKNIWMFYNDWTRNVLHPLHIPNAPDSVPRGDIAAFCVQTGGMINSYDPATDNRFNLEFAKAMVVSPRSILAVPIRDSGKQVIGVFVAVNKTVGARFSEKDEENAKIFSLLAGLSIERWKTKYPAAVIQESKPIESMIAADSLNNPYLPDNLKLFPPLNETAVSPEFNIVEYDEAQQFRFIIYYFETVGLLREFNIPIGKLIKLLRNVCSSYSQVPFYNWNNAINTLQMFICITFKTRLIGDFQPIELLATFYACICQHIACNNDEFKKVEDKLKIIYKTDTPFELFKCSKAIKAMHGTDCNILSNLTPEQAKDFWAIFRELVMCSSSKHYDILTILKSTECTMETDKGRLLYMKLILTISHFATYTRPTEIAFQWACALYISKNNEYDKSRIIQNQIDTYKQVYKPLLDALVQRLDGIEFLEETAQNIIQYLKSMK